jgi:hypothetical protein
LAITQSQLREAYVSSIVAIIIGVVLAGATIAGVATSVGSHSHHGSTTPVANVALYGSR